MEISKHKNRFLLLNVSESIPYRPSNAVKKRSYGDDNDLNDLLFLANCLLQNLMIMYCFSDSLGIRPSIDNLIVLDERLLRASYFNKVDHSLC